MANANHPVRPALSTPVQEQQCPAHTCKPYDQVTRRTAVVLYISGQDDNERIRALRTGKVWPSKSTVRRWTCRLVNNGQLAPYQHTGNKRASVLRGPDLVLLDLYRVLFPKALHLEVAAFIWNAWGRLQNPPVLYGLPDISMAETRLGLTRKKGSTTAYQAYFPINIALWRAFWTQPWLYGIANIRREDMIDIDEAEFFLQLANRKYGKARRTERVRQPGNYGHCTKWTSILAIAGCLGPNDQYAEFEQRPGTDIITFANFIQVVLNRIGPAGPQNCQCFTMDNLLAHKHPVVLQMILNAGHRFAFCAPYYPVDGPIEYLFNVIAGKLLQDMHLVQNDVNLCNQMWVAINSFENFVGFFEEVEFQ